jgi:transketolase
MVRDALQVADILNEQYRINTRVVSMHTIKPLDRAMVLNCAKFPAVFTMEENNVIGGLGSAVAETIAESGVYPKHFKRFGFPDSFAMTTGIREYLNAQWGLDVESIAKNICQITGK